MGGLRSMGHGRCAVFVDQMTGVEAIERKRLVEGVRAILGHRMGHDLPRAWRGLEAARAPAAVDVKALDPREPADRAAIGRDTHGASPLPVNAASGKHGKPVVPRSLARL